jgi:hypothetical protein
VTPTLPIPTAEEVKEFQALYLREFDVALSLSDATELATKAVQLFYIKNYALPDLRSKKQ